MLLVELLAVQEPGSQASEPRVLQLVQAQVLELGLRLVQVLELRRQVWLVQELELGLELHHLVITHGLL